MTSEPPTTSQPVPPDDAGSVGSDAAPPGPPAPSGVPSAAPVQAVELDLFGHAPKGRPDWSHRRGEPRVFALLWTLFLTVLATSTLMRAAVGGRLDLSTYRESLRAMLMVVATAIVVAWPLLRLSQARPRGGGVGSTFKDVLIVLVPLQAVLWPQAILAHWSLPVVAALDGVMASWTLLLGGVVALTLGPSTQPPQGLPDAEITRPDSTNGRTGAMAIVVGLGAVGGAVAFVLDAALRPTRAGFDTGSWWMILSPHTAIHEITRDRAELGVSTRVERAHAVALAVQAGAGVLLWIAAIAREWMAPPTGAVDDVAPVAPVTPVTPASSVESPPSPALDMNIRSGGAPPDTPGRPRGSVGESPKDETATTAGAELPGWPLAPDPPAR